MEDVGVSSGVADWLGGSEKEGQQVMVLSIMHIHGEIRRENDKHNASRTAKE
jgi:hypothetical protein